MKQPDEILKALQGDWEGVCRTWEQPGKISDESTVSGTIRPVLGGPLLRHQYEGSYQGKPRSGEETLVFNSAKGRFETAWIDSFHMNYGIMYCEGESTDRGFFVLGSYDVAPNQPAWGWRTVYEISQDGKLTITAFNVTPDGQEAKAVETVYKRRSDH